MQRVRRSVLSVADYVAGVTAGDRATLARAITLVESARADHQAQAREVLAQLAGRTGRAWRVGITGTPGVGKSSLVEALGTRLTAEGRRVAVLAVDPSSALTGGSILGDKTRMARLSVDPNAFVRPSPTSGTLGGVARQTRESLLLCEAAGFDVVLVETVGVGQSEITVAGMTDFFLALMLPGAGDELQGIKRGVLELADAIAVNKADGDNVTRANQAAQEYRNALRYLTPRQPWWTPRVITCSALTGSKLDRVWQAVMDHREALQADGRLAERRRAQDLQWLNQQLTDGLQALLDQGPTGRAVADARARVARGELPASVAAGALLSRLSLAYGAGQPGDAE